MDTAIGGDPREGPLFSPMEKGQKNSRKTQRESKQKIFLQPHVQQKISFFSEPILRTKIKKFSKKFNAIFQRQSKRMQKIFLQVPKNETKNFSEKIFFRIFKKNENLILTFSHKVSKSKIAKQIWCNFRFFNFLYLFFTFYGSTT